MLKSSTKIECISQTRPGVIPTSLACPVVVLSCFACLVFNSDQFQGHLKQLRHVVVSTLLIKALLMKTK